MTPAAFSTIRTVCPFLQDLTISSYGLDWQGEGKLELRGAVFSPFVASSLTKVGKVSGHYGFWISCYGRLRVGQFEGVDVVRCHGCVLDLFAGAKVLGLGDHT